MKKSTLQTMHDQSIECGMKLDWAWAIARIVEKHGELSDCPQWAVKDCIGAIDYLIGEAKSDLIKIGISIENELHK